MFDIFLALKRGSDRFMCFEVHQGFDAVAPGEAFGQPCPVLLDAPHEIVRNTDIERSTGLAGENIYPISHFEFDGLPGQARQ